jgi:hypothetical protein
VVQRISQPGETLLDSGFVATAMADERPIPGYYADQLLAALDVSDRVFAAADRATPAQRDSVLRRTVDAVRDELRDRYAGRAEGDSVWVQMIPLYDGGRWSAYVFRRFTDVRLAAAAELQMGFFGGDPDNFTYPRYALDFGLLRIYGRDGQPYEPTDWFGWSLDGVQEGDVVFVIGNPGSTNRLKTIAQLEYQRDVSVPAIVSLLETRLDIMGRYRETRPPEEQDAIRNQMFGLSNSLKASSGRLAALQDPVIMARKADAERQLRSAIDEDPALSQRYARVFDRLSDIQTERRSVAREYAAFLGMDQRFASALQRRARIALAWLDARDEGQPADSLALLRTELERIRDQPPELERMYLAQRLEDLQRYLGPEHEAVQAILDGRSPSEAAEALLASSVLATAARATRAMDSDSLSAADPGITMAEAIRPYYRRYLEVANRLGPEESDLESDLGRARFAVYGKTVPPDGTFSPRITDGVVRSYPYNGTIAPPYTTFYGIYDRHFGHEGSVDWELPLRWRTPPAGLDLSTPLNFVSTADTYGGNSGSPAVTPELELVGLNFDRNIDGLSRDFIYLPERGRNVMVDVRAIREALQKVYGATRLLSELESGAAAARARR